MGLASFTQLRPGRLGRIKSHVSLMKKFFHGPEAPSWLSNSPRLIVMGTGPLDDGIGFWAMALQISWARAKAKAGEGMVVKPWGERRRWHKLFGHGFRFPKGLLASPGQEKGSEEGGDVTPFP